MNDDQLFERAVDDWLDAGSDRTPRPAVDAVLLAIRTTPQERDPRIPWRIPNMSNPLRLGAAIAVIAVVGVLGLNFLLPETGPGAVVAPTPSPTATPGPTSTPVPTPISPAGSLNTSTWADYTSSQYGFTLGYPPDWAVEPASRAWTYETDGASANMISTPAADLFANPTGDVVVSTWSVPVDPSSMPSWQDLSWSFIETWAQEDCLQLTGRSCVGIAERAEPMCLEKADCHQAAVLVPGEGEVVAYLLDHDNARMQIVTVWQPDLDPSVTRYGGGRNLLEAFLETKNVWPESSR